MIRVLGRYKVYTLFTKNAGTYNYLNPATFIEVPVPGKDSQRPYICVDFDSVSTFHLLEVGTVPTVWYFWSSLFLCSLCFVGVFLGVVWFCCFFYTLLYPNTLC